MSDDDYCFVSAGEGRAVEICNQIERCSADLAPGFAALITADGQPLFTPATMSPSVAARLAPWVAALSTYGGTAGKVLDSGNMLRMRIDTEGFSLLLFPLPTRRDIAILAALPAKSGRGRADLAALVDQISGLLHDASREWLMHRSPPSA